MGIYCEELKREQKILNEILNNLKYINTITIEDENIKELIAETLSEKIQTLSNTIEHLDYWNNKEEEENSFQFDFDNR